MTNSLPRGEVIMSAATSEVEFRPRSAARRSKGYRGFAMEGSIARWYARIRSGPDYVAQCASQAREFTRDLPDGAEILEVAPGPGVLAVELARLGRFQVTGVDISRTFVEIARQRAQEAGVRVKFLEGNASQLPFSNSSFDLIVSQAAFKNFSEPQAAVDEMYRVLRPGGRAILQDMRKESTDESIRQEVRVMKLGAISSFMTRRTLFSLRRRAYSKEDFEGFARRSPFGSCTVTSYGIGQEVRLRK